jgi:hypothetical protein
VTETPPALAVMVTPCCAELSAPDFATKMAVIAPAGTVTDAGTVSTLELLVRAMVSAARAGLARATWQVALELFVMIPALPTTGTAQLRLERRTAGSTVRVAVCCTLFNWAMIVAAVTLVTDVVVAGNVPVVLPGGILNVAGTVTFAELLVRLIDAPPEPALADRVTVHVLEAPPTTVAGAQVTEEMVTDASAGSTVRVAACCRPFKVATIVAAVTLVTDVVVAVNVPVLLPAAIVRVAGTVTCVELLDRLIDTPAAPAPAEMVAVH